MVKRWRLIYDLKNIGSLPWVTMSAYLLCILFFTCFRMVFTAQTANAFFGNGGYFFFLDCLFPVLAMCNITYLFGENFEYSSLAFLLTLPFSYFQLLTVRFWRMMLFFFTPYVILIAIITIQLQGTSTFLDCLLRSAPNFIFLPAIALVVVVITKKSFHSLVLCGGFIVVDLASLGTVFWEKSLFINTALVKFPEFEVINRLSYLAAGFLLTAVPPFILGLRAYRKSMR